MEKYVLTPLIIFVPYASFAQTNSFDVFTFQSPEHFIKSELPSRAQWRMKNKDASFCVITVYKSQSAKDNIMKGVMAQWNEQVVKQLNIANKEPLKAMTEQLWDGWASTLAIGNFYQNKKNCVVMLSSFRKEKIAACAVVAFSDKIFKGPIETFLKNLHLNN